MFLQSVVNPPFHIYQMLVNAVTSQQILFQHTTCPLTKLHTTNGIDSISNADNHVKVVDCHVVRLGHTLYGAVLSGCCIFCNNHIPLQFSTL